MDKKEVIASAIHRIDVEDYDRQSSIEQMYDDIVEKAWTFIKRNCYNSATLESKFRKAMEG